MRSRDWVAVLSLGALALTALPVAAQRGPRPHRAGPASAGVEQALRLRTALELSEDQIAALDEIRLQGVSQQQAMLAERLKLTSDLRAGEITRGQMLDALDGRREEGRERYQEMRNQLEEILTEEQLGELRDARGPGFGQGRRGVRGQQGFRGRAGPRGQGIRLRRNDARFQGPGALHGGSGRIPAGPGSPEPGAPPSW